MGKCPFYVSVCSIRSSTSPPPPFRRSGDEPGELSRYKQKGHLLMGKCPFLFICMLHTFLYIPSPSFSPQRGRTGERVKPSPQMSCCCKR